MPDTDKKEDEQKEWPDEAVNSDVLVGEVRSDVPPLKEDGEAEKTEPVPDLVPDSYKQSKPDDDTTPFDDDKTEQAINAIVAKEADELLAVQDAAAAKGGVKLPKRGGRFVRFLRSKWTRSIILLLLLGGVAALVAIPKTRYWSLNTAGVRSSSSVVVLDSTTQLPLKGVQVKIGNQEKKTDSDGATKFANLELGPTQLVINQIGFEEVRRNITIGWGSNPLGNFELIATGVQYVIEVRDYLSEKPLEGVEATDGAVTAISGKDGKITLTLDDPVVAEGGISLSKSGYRTEAITLDKDPKRATKAVLVLARKAVFATRQSGKYDLYKSDIDGRNREILLPGTGSETSNVSLVVSPDGNRIAWVSTRDNKRDASDFLLSSLMLINVEDGETLTIAESAQIQLIDWVGSRLVFRLASADSTSGSRHTVVSYDYTNNTRLQLTAANQLGAVMSAQGVVYYSVGIDASSPAVQVGLFKINPDGTGKQRIFEDELTTVLRSTYGSLSVQAISGTWYTYELSNGAKAQIASPSSLVNRLYIDNASRSTSLWIKPGVLTSHDIASGKDTSVKTQSGLTYPIQWLSDSAAVYRFSNGSETAEYAVSVLGGDAHKVADVATSYGFAQAQ